MKTVTIPFDLELAKKIQNGEVEGKIVDKRKVIMEPEDIYEMLMDIYMQNYIEDDELDKYVKEAALFYREVSKPL